MEPNDSSFPACNRRYWESARIVLRETTAPDRNVAEFLDDDAAIESALAPLNLRISQAKERVDERLRVAVSALSEWITLDVRTRATVLAMVGGDQ